MNKQHPEKSNPDHSGLDSPQVAAGPTSIAGAEASELPDKGRGSVDTSIGKALSRKTPDRTGGQVDGDVGVRAFPESADAADHGPRGNN